MDERRKTFVASIVALFIGAIGACGQAYLLYHELVDTYPYKVINADYGAVGRIGVWLAPLIAILLGVLFVRTRLWLSLLLPVVLSPLLFALIYKIFGVVYGLTLNPNMTGEFTTASADQQFYSSCLTLAGAGFVIGGALSLWFIKRTKK